MGIVLAVFAFIGPLVEYAAVGALIAVEGFFFMTIDALFPAFAAEMAVVAAEAAAMAAEAGGVGTVGSAISLTSEVVGSSLGLEAGADVVSFVSTEASSLVTAEASNAFIISAEDAIAMGITDAEQLAEIAGWGSITTASGSKSILQSGLSSGMISDLTIQIADVGLEMPEFALEDLPDAMSTYFSSSGSSIMGDLPVVAAGGQIVPYMGQTSAQAVSDLAAGGAMVQRSGAQISKGKNDTFDMNQYSGVRPRMILKAEDNKYNRVIRDERLVLVWWHQPSGQAMVCWESNPKACGAIWGLWLTCYDWTNTNVPHDIAKLPWPNVNAFTPNGTAVIWSPDKTSVTKGKWAAPTAGDCEYWDRDWNPEDAEERVEEYEHADKDWVADSFMKGSWQPPKFRAAPLHQKVNMTKVYANREKVTEGGTDNPAKQHDGSASDTHIRRRQDVGEQLSQHFSNLPRKRSPGALKDYIDVGADIVLAHIAAHQSQGLLKSQGTRESIQQAIEEISKAHDKHYSGSFVERMSTPSVESGGTIVNGLVDAVVARVRPDDRRRMETFAVAAMAESPLNRALNGTASRIDGMVLRSLWERVHG
ncbi:hypothetical protein LTR78_009617 [Recurvomyces mirabilis]|uniref:Uncharacterized protein n=1 Tax=Recurvomyces mirabilis TaxID=574656 RepID=A0AAE0TNC6_9PEZI|nr:hypothetical protein LTR78_009617 [Recurvomyces mirabilis]KAK5156616.1 hypothetical protein LTS14_004828 [Recurvomyces mirabilis]